MPLPRHSVLWALALAAVTSDTSAQVADHLHCYKVKDPLKLRAIVDVGSGVLGLQPGCRLSKAKMICEPATKTVVSAEDRGTKTPITPLPVTGDEQRLHQVCYRVVCPGLTAPDRAVTDQFGARTYTKLRSYLLCTPGASGPSTTTTTTTTSSTTSITSGCTADAFEPTSFPSSAHAFGTFTDVGFTVTIPASLAPDEDDDFYVMVIEDTFAFELNLGMSLSLPAGTTYDVVVYARALGGSSWTVLPPATYSRSGGQLIATYEPYDVPVTPDDTAEYGFQVKRLAPDAVCTTYDLEVSDD